MLPPSSPITTKSLDRGLQTLAAIRTRWLDKLASFFLRPFGARFAGPSCRLARRGGRDQMPALDLELKSRGRWVVPHKAKNRYCDRLSGAMEKATTTKEPDLEDDVARAASGEQGEGKAGTSDRA